MKKRDDVYLSKLLERILRIEKQIKGLSEAKFLKSELHHSAVVRELEVIGEAAKFISEATRKKFLKIPWAQIVGMRNRLIHQYFDVDYRIVWEVAKTELPQLRSEIRSAILDTAPLVHPWRLCPLGFYHVGPFPRNTPKGTETSVREHCRKNPSGKDQLYPPEIKRITENQINGFSDTSSLGTLKKFKFQAAFDREILLWTKYWNDIFQSPAPLGPRNVKALICSESSFRKGISANRISKDNFARGLLQISDKTRRILADERGELGDHFLTLSRADVCDPAIAISAAVRWLFYKKEMAGKFLKKIASWEEAVADYKGYLRLKGNYRDRTGMNRFVGFLEELVRTPA